MFVRSWMTKPAISIEADATLYEASLMMDRRKIRRLPVTKSGKLVGMITRSDVSATVGKLRDSGDAKERAQKTLVKSVMAKKPVTVESSETLDAAAQLMLRRKVSGIPVLDSGKLVGVLTESDIFYALCTMLGFTQKGARVVLSLRPNEDLVDQLQKSVGAMSVQGIVSYYNPDEKTVDTFVRLRGRKTR